MENPDGSKPNTPDSTEIPRAVPDATQTNPEPDRGSHENHEAPAWREVAAQAAVESDPNRLSDLVDELIRLLDEERRTKRRTKE